VLPASDAGRRISVEFDGIFRNATVFFNGHFIAENMSGYAPLNLDLTDFANFADKAAMDRLASDQARLEKAQAARTRRAARIKAECQTPGKNVLVVRVDRRRSTRDGSMRARASIATPGSPRPRRYTSRVGELCAVGLRGRNGSGDTRRSGDGPSEHRVINDSDVNVVGRVHAALVDAAGKTVATAVSDPGDH